MELRYGYLTRRCANGAERDRGRLIHALAKPARYPDLGPALCGAEPGRRSAGFASDERCATATCKKCLAIIASWPECPLPTDGTRGPELER